MCISTKDDDPLHTKTYKSNFYKRRKENVDTTIFVTFFFSSFSFCFLLPIFALRFKLVGRFKDQPYHFGLRKNVEKQILMKKGAVIHTDINFWKWLHYKISIRRCEHWCIFCIEAMQKFFRRWFTSSFFILGTLFHFNFRIVYTINFLAMRSFGLKLI